LLLLHNNWETLFPAIQAMAQNQSKRRNSITEYQKTAKSLEAELVKAFEKLNKRIDKELWKPLNSKDDIPKLDDVIKEIHENIERLHALDPEEKSKSLYDKVKRGINQFVKWTLPALKNFIIATENAQSVSKHG
jgi:septal ring factor EnvC (AmiA/AmiB activator)